MRSPATSHFSEGDLFLQSWTAAAGGLTRGSLVRLWAVPLVLEIVILVVAMGFYRAPLDTLFIPIFKAVGGSTALSYPQAYFSLPRVFLGIDLLFYLAIGWLFQALVVVALPHAFRGRDAAVRVSAGRLRGRWPAVWAAAVLPFVAFRIGELVLHRVEMATMWEASPVLIAIKGGIFTTAALFETLLVFALPAVVLGGCTLAQSIRRSFTLSSRSFWITLGFVVLTRILLVPLRLLELQLLRGTIFGPPENSGFVAVAGIVVAWIALAVRTGVVTRFYLYWHGLEGSE